MGTREDDKVGPESSVRMWKALLYHVIAVWLKRIALVR